MQSKSLGPGSPTVTYQEQDGILGKNGLCKHYDSILQSSKIDWTTHLTFRKKLGAGGQGVVYYSEQKGADEFTLPVALKIFSPERFNTDSDYASAMKSIACVTAHVARIQHDNLIDVQNFVEREGIRIMIMEWIDGVDLRQLLDPTILEKTQYRVSQKRWNYINRVVVTDGVNQNRLQPGVAVAIVRECLAALAALHRNGIVHGDIKPANIMLKRTGKVKIIDIGSAYELDSPPSLAMCSPSYAALEVIQGEASNFNSDLASLGYVLIELLAGQRVMPEDPTFEELVQAKQSLPDRLHEFLPDDIMRNDLLVNFCRRMIEPDPARRFQNAENAEFEDEGAAAFLRQLVISDLASEYENEIRVWLEEICEMWEEDLEDGV